MARYGPGSFLGGLCRSGLPRKRNVTGLTGLSQFHRKKRPVRHHGAGVIRAEPGKPLAGHAADLHFIDGFRRDVVYHRFFRLDKPLQALLP